uniref:Uncharacterized protein n=1 Tax=Heterorhabditis bacteriophora TaxID=37862 RepID=A0A1I7X8E5_HETBA
MFYSMNYSLRCSLFRRTFNIILHCYVVGRLKYNSIVYNSHQSDESAYFYTFHLKFGLSEISRLDSHLYSHVALFLGTTLLDLLTRPVQRVAQSVSQTRQFVSTQVLRFCNYGTCRYRSFFSSLLSHKIEGKEVELVQSKSFEFIIHTFKLDYRLTFEISWTRTDCLGENTRHKPLYILPVIGMNVLYIPIEGVIAVSDYSKLITVLFNFLDVSCDDVVLHFTSNSFTSLRNWSVLFILIILYALPRMDEFRRCLSDSTPLFHYLLVNYFTFKVAIDESYKASDEFSSSPTDRQHKKLQRLTAQAIRSDNFDNNSRLTEELNSLRRESTPVEDSDELVAKRSFVFFKFSY